MENLARRLLVLFLCLLLPLPLLRAYQEEYYAGGIIYGVDDAEATVIGVYDYDLRYAVIQEEVDGVPVTILGSGVFEDCTSLKSVTIPATITGIEEDFPPREAFDDCPSLVAINVSEDNSVYASRDGVLYSKDLKTLYFCPEGRTGTLTVPEGVTTIYEDAFAYTQLERIILPKSVTEIDYAFACAYNLASFEVAAGNEAYTAIDGVLYSAGGTEIVCYPPARPEAVFTIPDTVRRISGDNNFYDALYLAGLVIGDSVEEFEDYALYGTVFYVQTDNEIVKASLEENTPEILVVGTEDEAPQIVTVGGVIYAIYDDEAFAFRMTNKSVTSFDIPHTINGYPVTTICSGVVDGCHKLEGVAIGDNVAGFGEDAFKDCYNLSTIYTDNDNVVEYFGNDFTFLPYSDYSYETTVNGIVYRIAHGEATAIGAENAKTSSLEILPEVDGVPVTAIGEAAFAMRGATIHVSLPDSLKTIGNYAFDLNHNLYDIVLPPSLVEIGDYAFRYCESLASLTIPATVERIGELAFGGPNQLSAIEVADGNMHFFSLDGVLYQVEGDDEEESESDEEDDDDYPESTRSVVNQLLVGATLLRYPPQKPTSVFTVPNGVKALAEGAFNECLNLAVINLPASVEDVTGLNPYGGLNNYGTKFSAVNVAAGSEYFASRDGVLYTADMSELLIFPRAKAGTEFTIPAETSAGHDVLRSSDLQAIDVEDGNKAYASRDGVLYTADMSKLLLYPNAKVSNEFTVPAEMTYGWEILADLKLQAILVEDGNETFASRDGVLYTADMTELLIYPCARKDSVFAIPEEVVYIDHFYAFEMAKYKGNLKGLVIGDNMSVYYDGLSYFYRIFPDWWSLKYVQTDNAEVIDWFAENRPDVLIVSRADEPPELPYETIVNGIKYYVNTLDNEVEVIGAISKKITEAVIPEEIDGYPVTRLGWEYYDNDSDYEGPRPYFEYCFYLERVVLPSSLHVIGIKAFSYCYSLKEITLPEGLEEICMKAFLGCTGLTSITIPASIRTLDYGVFMDCSNLRSLTVAEDSESFTSVDGVIYDKNCTALVYCPEGIEALTLPATVESLSYDERDEYDDPWNLGTNLKSIDVEKGNEVFAAQDGVLYTADMKKLVFYPYEKEGDTFTLPATVTEIKAGGLYGFSGQEYQVEEGNTSYTTQEGVLYTADMTSLVAYPWKYPATVFTVPETVANLNIDSHYLVAVVIPNTEMVFDELSLWGDRLTFVQTDNESFRNIAENNSDFVTPGLIFLGMDEEMPEMPRFVQQDGLCFRLMGGEAAVIGVKDLEMTEVVIPEQVEGCPVTAIQGKGTIKLPIMHSLSIPATLTALPVDYEYDDDKLHIAYPYTSQWFERYEVAAGNPAFSSREGVLFSADGSVLIHYPQARPDAVYAIPDGCMTIAEDSMFDALYLETLVIPDSVEILEEWPFAYDYAPRELIIGDGVKEIGTKLFDYDWYTPVTIETVYTDNKYVINWFAEYMPAAVILPRDDWGIISVKCPLAIGWNLVGIPLELDETSKEAIADYCPLPLAYDYAAKAYVFAETDYVPGTAVWLFATKEGTLILRGTPVQSDGTDLLQGWNLVSPLYGETGNPGLDQVWYWTPEGMQRLTPEEGVKPGVGYWIYSDELQTIW